MTDTKELAEAHWQWVQGLLEAAGIAEDKIRLAEYAYLTAWEHAVKHERENATALCSVRLDVHDAISEVAL